MCAISAPNMPKHTRHAPNNDQNKNWIKLWSETYAYEDFFIFFSFSKFGLGGGGGELF